MKLVELNPRWIGMLYPAFVDGVPQSVKDLPIYRGVSFDCPHCKVQRLAVLFDPPINESSYVVRDEPIPPAGQLIWNRTAGTTFDALTLSPSVDASNQIGFKNHWHGFITAGEIR